jgi:hypothetical protein
MSENTFGIEKRLCNEGYLGGVVQLACEAGRSRRLRNPESSQNERIIYFFRKFHKSNTRAPTTTTSKNVTTKRRTHSSWKSLMRAGMLVAVGARGRTVLLATNGVLRAESDSRAKKLLSQKSCFVKSCSHFTAIRSSTLRGVLEMGSFSLSARSFSILRRSKMQPEAGDNTGSLGTSPDTIPQTSTECCTSATPMFNIAQSF